MTETGQDDGTERVDVGEAARRLHITTDAVRKRIRRKVLAGELVDGHWIVVLPRIGPVQDSGTPEEDKAIAELKRQVDDITRRLEEVTRRGDEIASERDYLRNALAAALTIKALLPERTAPAEPEAAPRRPWWQVWKR